MKHTIKNTSGTTKVLTISLDKEDLAKIKKLTLVHLSKNVKVAGFRQGKTPPAVAEKRLDQATLQTHIIEDAVNSFVSQVLDETKIIPLDRPKVDIKKVVPDELLEFTAELEVIPEIKLGDYKKLKATKQEVKVAQSDIDEVVERLQKAGAEKKPAERAAKLEDELIIDFVGTDKDGKDVAGATGKDYPLGLGSKTFIPGFEEGLVGKKAGEEVELKLTFPKDYHSKTLAGQKVNFKVTIKAVNELALPKLDDEFAQKTGAFKTVAELKADIKKELTAQREQEAEDKLRDSLIEQLVKASSAPVPEVLVNDQIQSLERDFTQNLMYRGLTLDQYLQDKSLSREDWQKTELRDAAVRRVQVGLVLSELSKVEKIEVTQEELEQRLNQLLENYGKSPEIAKQFDTPEARRDIANRVMTEKTVNRLVELNK